VSARARAPQRQRANRPRSARSAWFALAAIALLGVVAFTGWYLITPRRGRGVAVRVTVPAGVSAATLTTLLWRAGVIDRPWAFRPLLVLSGTHGRVRAGMVPLRDDLAPRAVLRALAYGGGLVRVTIPEGFTRFEIARRLDAMGVCDDEAFLASTESPEAVRRAGATAVGVAATVEGYLFPDTYDLPLGAPCDEVVERMTGVFHRRLDALRGRHPAGFARVAALAGDEGDPVRVLVTLASIVEKETGLPDDRPHVASVFWNRLTRPDFLPRLLQSDPTVTYGCLAGPRAGVPVACAAGDGGVAPITAAMLNDARNPWNTYRHEALPPTPVCNPGAAALAAVLDPMASDDLYFVARGDGRSVFAATLDAHRRNVREHLRRTPLGGAP
jgi:UPF0755 protein